MAWWAAPGAAAPCAATAGGEQEPALPRRLLCSMRMAATAAPCIPAPWLHRTCASMAATATRIHAILPQQPCASHPMPRATPASFTNWPSTVDSPPASFWNVTSAEKAVSSSTRPHWTQHLRGNGAGEEPRTQWGAAAAAAARRRHQHYDPPRAGLSRSGCCDRQLQQPLRSREAIGVVHLHLHVHLAVVAVDHGGSALVG